MEQKKSDWIQWACSHANEYVTRFVNNPGLGRIVSEFDPEYMQIQSPAQRLDRLSVIAADNWDFRKGKERYEIVADAPMDQPGSEQGTIIVDGTKYMGLASSSSATLRHYTIVAVLGGANKSPYCRLRYALEQDITYDKLVFLGCEREVLPPEQAQTSDYAPGARTEYDLGVGAVRTLLGAELVDTEGREAKDSDSRVMHFQKKDGTPVLVMSSPAYSGRQRANTSDTYQFLIKTFGDDIGSGKDVLFVTSAMYRYAQYFDAVRDVLLKTGANIETIGYEPSYAAMDFKPSQFLQELKSAVSAAIRLRDAIREYGFSEGVAA